METLVAARAGHESITTATNDGHPWMCDYTKDHANIQDVDEEMQHKINTAEVIYPTYPLNKALKMVEEDFVNPYNFTRTSDYINAEMEIDVESSVDIILKEPHPTYMDIGTCTMTWDEYEQLFRANIVLKQVIAHQPIQRGESCCTEGCDIENHHVHTYCRLCKRNLYFGTTIHNCVMGFEPGKIRPDMIPEYLANTPWWQEPEAVQIETITIFLLDY